MTKLLLDHPTPDFNELLYGLKGEQAPRRVHHVEVGIDPEVLPTSRNPCSGCEGRDDCVQ